MFTSLGFRLYDIETIFSTHSNAFLYCSGVIPHSCKISDSRTSDRSLIVKIQESTLSIRFLLCFTMVSSIFSSERTVLVLSVCAHKMESIKSIRYTLFLSTSGCMMVGLYFLHYVAHFRIFCLIR